MPSLTKSNTSTHNEKQLLARDSVDFQVIRFLYYDGVAGTANSYTCKSLDIFKKNWMKIKKLIVLRVLDTKVTPGYFTQTITKFVF